MPLDTSIPLDFQASQPQQGLQAAAGTIGLATDLQQLKQMRTQFNANQAISDAVQQSTDPNTGQVDFGKLQAIASQNGAGAYLPDFMEKIATIRNQQQQYDASKLDMALKQQSAIRGRIGALLAEPDLGVKDMSSKISSTIANGYLDGIIPADQATREMTNIPTDPKEQADWVNQHFLTSLSGEAQLHAMVPENVMVNTGGQTILLNRNPMTGQSRLGTTIKNTLSPEAQSQLVDVIGPDKTPYKVPKSALVTPTGQSKVSTNGMPGVQSGLSPGEQAALTAQGASANAAAQSLHDSASDAPMRINLLEQARQNLEGIQTGPGTEQRNDAESFLNALSPPIAKQLGYTGKIKDYDEFKKILTNYASSISGSLGTGTDARLNAAVTGNANPNISKMANEDILTKTIAAEKMRQAQDYAFQNSGLTTDKFNQWQSQWNNAVNPQVFAFDAMTGDKQAEFKAAQQKAGTWGKFASDYMKLKRAGLLDLTGQQ